MSIRSSLVLVLLCFTFHACNARSFGVVMNKEETPKEFQSTTKENEKLNVAWVSVSNMRKGDYKGNSDFEDPRKNNIQVKNDQTKVLKTTQTGSALTTVSWRVPHKKRGEPEPGFNLDYLPPKTHPPVHN